MKEQSLQKKMPERRCVGCNQHAPKSALIRIVRTPDGNVVLDRTGKVGGRGAYLHPDPKCLGRARKTGRLSQNLSQAIPDGIYASLEKELTDRGE